MIDIVLKRLSRLSLELPNCYLNVYLERMEVAKAAGQTDQVEYKLMEVKQQLE